MSELGFVKDGALLFSEGRVAAAGPRESVLRHPQAASAAVYDAGGRLVLPGFVDSHTHPVFAEPRLRDFESRLQGKSYAQIQEEGGGIFSSVAAVRAASQEALAARFAVQARRFLECGTTTIEAKSGYGLDLESELKMLRALRAGAGASGLEAVATFLGAHAIAPEYRDRPDDYVALVCERMIPAVAREALARYVDAFCEAGYFSAAQVERLFAAATSAGLGLRVHAEQLSHGGGARIAAKFKAASADHLDHADDADIEALRAAGTIATLVPGANHFLGLDAFPPARRMIERGLAVALATDFNPGTCPCWNMQQVLSLAATRMRMSAQEAIVAATINGACALGLGSTHGSLEPGKAADAAVFDCEDPRELAYWFGANLATAVFKRGELVAGEKALKK